MPQGNERFARYVDLYLGRGLYLHWQRTPNYKTLRFDFVISHPLRRPDNAHLALVGRLCERGTRLLPDMQSLNRAADNLYGAYYTVDIGSMADRQFLHVALELLDPRFVAAGEREELLLRALDMVHQIAMDPLREGDGYKASYLEQEKRALTAHIHSLYNDKMAYAQWRCAREMDGDCFAGLPAQVEDVAAVDPPDLWDFQTELMRNGEIHFYASGWIHPAQISTIAERVQTWRQARPNPVVGSVSPVEAPAARCVFECGEVNQSRLVCGYGVALPDSAADYARLLLFNTIWGGEAQSLLFRRLREERGLCYYIDSQIDAFAGRAYVLAGIDRQDYSRVVEEIDRALEDVANESIEESGFEQGRALLQHRIAALCEDRDALIRMNLRGHFAGMRMGGEELLRLVGALSVRDMAIAARQVVFSLAYLLHDRSAVGKNST